MKLRILKLHPEARAPQYATEGAACFDLCAIDIPGGYQNIDDDAYGPCIFRTGLALEVPADHVMLIFSRSGHGFKHDVRLANCVGVIDSDYRGEVQVKLTCDDSLRSFRVNNGDRIAQAMILPIPRVEFEVAEQLTMTDRGTGGFGSTGVNAI